MEIPKLLTYLLLIVSNLALTQVEWGYATNGAFSDLGKAVFTDADENVFFLGNASSAFDLDPGPEELITAGNSYLQKLSPEGELIWGFAIDWWASDMAMDNAGNIYLTGFSAILGQSYDVFVEKYDPLGNFIWQKSFGGLAVDRANALVIDNSNNILITGEFKESVDFDPGPEEHWRTSNGTQDVYLLKLDTSGKYLSVQTMGGFGSTYSRDLISDIDNNIYILGVYQDSMNFYGEPVDFTLTDNGKNSNLFVVKYDSLLNYQWSKKLGETSSFRRKQFTVDENQSIYTSYFDSGDTKLVKLDSAGTETVLTSFSSQPDSYDISEPLVTYDNSTYLYLVDDLGSKTRVSKYDLNGILLNYKIIEGTRKIISNQICVGQDETVYLSGSFYGEINAPNLNGENAIIADHSFEDDMGNSTADAFQLKLDLSGTIDYPKADQLILWPNPTSTVINIDADPAKSGAVKVYDASGRIVLEDNMYNQFFSLNVNGLSQGAYVIHFEYDGETVMRQFIKI
ncbi:MAG: T9SS type A sorting domain-containing protein [Crocinitomix sp.]|nr:T9SS type A sorting domain-containing protein [Crocinitomix sp.]